jgi:hypothetical protein
MVPFAEAKSRRKSGDWRQAVAASLFAGRASLT